MDDVFAIFDTKMSNIYDIVSLLNDTLPPYNGGRNRDEEQQPFLDIQL